MVSWKACPFLSPSILDYLLSRELRRFRLTITSAHLTSDRNYDKIKLIDETNLSRTFQRSTVVSSDTGRLRIIK